MPPASVPAIAHNPWTGLGRALPANGKIAKQIDPKADKPPGMHRNSRLAERFEHQNEHC